MLASGFGKLIPMKYHISFAISIARRYQVATGIGLAMIATKARSERPGSWKKVVIEFEKAINKTTVQCKNKVVLIERFAADVKPDAIFANSATARAPSAPEARRAHNVPTGRRRKYAA